MLSLLNEPACGLLQNLNIDHDYVEVLPSGTCLNILKKTFELRQQMNDTPRAFVHYIYDKHCVPFPQRFISGELPCYYIADTCKHCLFYVLISVDILMRVHHIFYHYCTLFKISFECVTQMKM